MTIAADERDIIRLRTTVRREDVYLYRLQAGVFSATKAVVLVK